MFCLNVVDIASKYKASVPIGGIILKIEDFDLKNILTSKAVAIAFKKIFNDPKCPLTYPKLLLTNKGSEFRGDCERLIKKHCVKIQKTNSRCTMGIVERYN